MVHAWCVFVTGIHPSEHECQDLLSPCNGMHMCTDQTLVYTLTQKSFGGMESEPMLTQKEKSPLREAQRRVKPVTLHHCPVEGIFLLELTWVLTPFPPNSFGWEYRPRYSLCTHAFHHTGIHVLDGRMLATKPHLACTIHEDRMWLPLWFYLNKKNSHTC